MKTKLELGLIESEGFLKKGGMLIVSNIGKTVAIITVFVAILVTFTDISFQDLRTESFATEAALLLIAAYLMYFSLEDAGEKLGEESDEYREALSLYLKEREKINGEKMDTLRDFCLDYSREELVYRRKSYLYSNALSENDLEKYLSGERFTRKKERVLRRAAGLKAVNLTPSMLLTKERVKSKSELISPEKGKLLRLIVKLIPTTVCMTVTVSVMLTAKDGLTAATVIEGILKLSTLPIVGFRGYASGYSYVRRSYIPWIETKRRLLEAYNKKEMAVLTLSEECDKIS